jgi:hypothetical protein
MIRYCIECGTELSASARFCGSCGHAVVAASETSPLPADATPAAYSTVVTEEPVATPQPEPVYESNAQAEPDFSEPTAKGPNWLLIVGGAGILLLLLLYYLIFLRDDVGGNPALPAPVAKEAEKTDDVEVQQFFAVAEANIRDRATAQGSTITGKLARGLAASGKIIMGEDGTSQWLELAEGKGFVGMVNLAETKPPVIAKALGDKLWTTDTELDILAQADPAAPIIDRIAPGTQIRLFALTANDYVEIKLRKGGVGYIADGAKILSQTNVLGKPISISFNPSTCNFGGDLEVEFQKLSARVSAAHAAADAIDYPSEAAREKALGALEGKSTFQKLQRSFNGLSITAIAVHYESQSVYFADPAAKVIAAFRAAGHKVGADGSFPSDELLASVAASAGSGRAYGKSELSCGV